MEYPTKNSISTLAGIKSASKRSRFSVAFGIAGALFVAAISGSAFAAKGGIPGPPSDGGGGGAAPDYGDLLILYRDTDGVPIPSPAIPVVDPETGELVDGGLCWQPIAFNVSDEVGTSCPSSCSDDTTPEGDMLVNVDQFNCAVETGCTSCTHEADFGRTNVARTSDEVFDAQLEDVVVNLATADCTTLDPAGRMVASTVIDGDSVPPLISTSAIDSPLQNLAVYRQLILTGTIGVALPQEADRFDTAARGFGAAFDKGGEVNVDVVAYVNQLLGLSDQATTTILDPKICETYREEVAGQMELVEKCYLDYGAYSYDRGINFTGLPTPPYIPEGINTPGWFEYLVEATTDPTFTIAQGPILGAVFAGVGGDPINNIGGFVQAADDTRAVINFMHIWAVPEDYVTQVPCVASETDGYDLSISEESGLQVPKQIIDGSSDREFTVTVVNEGPDEAENVIVRVTAMVDGVHVSDSPWVWEGVTITTTSPFTMTDFVPIDIGGRTTIDWEAVVESEFDANPSNNIVTATSSVKVTGGGGGGGKP